MNARTWTVGFGTHAVSAAFDPATRGAQSPVFVFAHGAGGHMADRGMLALRSVLCAHGVGVVRFNFPYSERQSRRPDPMPLLQQCIATVTARVADELHADRLILGGRSMGGRAASLLVADGFACDGLLLLAYPLHPAGRPEKLRDAHLGRIAKPVLCCNGTRDPLCTRDLMDATVSRLRTSWRMHWLDGADHSFHVLKSSGRTDAGVLEEIGETTEQWLDGLHDRRSA